ncbi:MAG: hypothetical protein HC850_10015 [Rhodomicrobium sp.]|nr:hypothetical protein [Rhodomicrobium sp.]
MLTVGLLSATAALSRAPHIDRVAIDENLHWFRPDTAIGNQSSVVFVAPEAALLIDANIDSVAPFLRLFLEEHAGGKRWVVVTSHHHGDHTQGLEHFGRDVVSIATAGQRKRLETTPLTTPDSKPLDARALPHIALEQGVVLHLGDETIELLTPPARNSHTDGDVLVYFRRAGFSTSVITISLIDFR